MPEALSAEQLRKTSTATEVDCKTSEDLEPIQTIIGQDRAVKALQFGLNIKGQGFNIFITGYDGTGKTSAANRFINQIAEQQPTPDDWVYVNNFNDNYRPIAIRFPAGHARAFRQDMKNLVQDVSDEIQRAFDSDEYANKKDEITQQYQEEKDRLFREVNEYAQANNFAIQQSPRGFETVPINNEGKPIQGQDYNKLSAEERKELEEKGKEIQQSLKSTIRKIQKMDRELANEIHQLDQDVAKYGIEPMFNELKEKYEDMEAVHHYLDAVMEEILANLSFFRKGFSENQQNNDPYQAIQIERFMKQFEVNVLVDNKDLNGAPVVTEQNPTYNNLFGRIEKESQFGTLETDFTLIRQGAIHQANGGYIILPVVDLLRHILSWESLVNSLKNEEVTIEDATEKMGFMATKTLRPEPIPLDTKVILIGQPYHYQVLYNMMDDFRRLFKVKSDFDSTMERNNQNVRDYMGFICMLCNEQKELMHMNQEGLQKMVEYGARLADHQEKLSTEFRKIMDIVSEANYYAQQNGGKYIKAADIQTAIEENNYRSNLLQEKIQEMIYDCTLIIDVEGQKTGEVNGLAVLDLGDLRFGKPNKITASLGLGKGQILDIEREAQTGGPIHTKGVMILTGYLIEKYGMEHPLTLSIRLVFEQSYSGVDGDSASSAEAFAVMSEIGNLPLKQGIAVTGSMNQKGESQAIGGVNEKIEGFFEICKQKGLNGEQGVIIPASNVKNLMLKEEMVEECRKGNFNIWPIQSIDEGFEILSGLKSGEKDENGEYPESTFNKAIMDQIQEHYKKYKKVQQSFNKDES